MSLESGNALWLTVADADDYFDTRYGASEHWVSGVAKLAALTTAQNDLEGCGDYDFSADLAAPTAAMQRAVCEQALFRVRYPEAEERAALRAQGVIGAGVVQETYRDAPAKITIAPQAAALLTAHLSATSQSFEFTR